jgi:glyoxylase-like metal-dependent hydrolase (beta-lactamase superfamily II)/predicted DCC family thiol-disulfide oxidoreductase YuxK
VIRVLYDDQCEVCQAFASWLKLLDRKGRTVCVPIDPSTLPAIHASLELHACLRQLHVVTPDGRIYAGWDAVAFLARLFPSTWIIGAAGSVPPFSWLARLLYGYLAQNRYAVSKCRGGACRMARPEMVRKRASLGAFWTCHSMGMMVRFPLIAGVLALHLFSNLRVYLRTRRRRLDLLGGKLSILFLGGFPCDLVTLLFGEHFVGILYDGVVIDPGSTRMRRALARHVRHMPKGAIRAIAVTHHHEEHSGNLNWLSAETGAPVYASMATAQLLQPPVRLPWVRDVMIGQQPPLKAPLAPRGNHIGPLEVIPTPGHCSDHCSLYDPTEKILFAGDAFMGVYFSAPNPDVDSRAWIAALERLVALDIEILIEGHGHIHTLRPDVPDFLGLVIRRDPREELREKLRFLYWLREQIETGIQEGLPPRAIEATCFPWGQSHSWENFLNDELTRLLTRGHWSRTELVRSFVRENDAPLPTVYEIRRGSEP